MKSAKVKLENASGIFVKSEDGMDDDDDIPDLKLTVQIHWQADENFPKFKKSAGGTSTILLSGPGEFTMRKLHELLAPLSVTDTKFGEFNLDSPAEIRLLSWIGHTKEWEMDSQRLMSLASVTSNKKIDIAVLNKKMASKKRKPPENLLKSTRNRPGFLIRIHHPL